MSVRSTALLFALLTLLPTAANADDVLMHEFIPAVDPDEATQALGTRAKTPGANAAPAAPSGKDEPQAVDTVQPEALEAEAEEAANPGLEASSVPRSEYFRPDRLTSLDGGLDYYEAFTPAIAPFKRVSAFDGVRLDVDGKTPVLGVRDPRRRLVQVESAHAPAHDGRARDPFSAELLVDFRSGSSQPLPSVSPESRILGLESKPSLRVQIERDGADNFFIRALGPAPDAPVHLRFGTDAPRAYFAMELPRVPLRELPAIAKLEPSIVKRGQRFASELGITMRSDFRSAIEKLTQHFRAFEESETPPADTGDVYLDLARGKKGLCRHRAYAFVVTARALGIHARFVQNEAHAWVEVAVPGAAAEATFLRIDLGGASHGLTAHNAQDRPNYTPTEPDTLPKPETYQQSYARAAPPAAASGARGQGNGQGQGSQVSSGRWQTEQKSKNSPSSAASQDARASAQALAGNEPEASERGDTPFKAPLHVSIDERRISALRGGKLVLTGRLFDDAERGVEGLRVELWIAKRQERMLLAVQLTDAEGYFRADFGVPPDLEVGDYRLVVKSEGDATHAPVSTD